MSSQPPKRTSSMEMTLVRPREDLPPISSTPGPTIVQLADCERARARREIEDGAPTLDACPAAGCADCATCHGRHSVACGECGSHTKDCPGTCSACSVCRGVHMVSRAEYAAWRRNTPDAEPSP